MNSLVSALRTARFARAVLVYLAAYSGVAAWLPWTRAGGGTAPSWAAKLGFAHPFSSPAFVAGVVLLFASTLACTWGRRARLLRLRRGELPEAAVALPAVEGEDPAAFLRAHGFRGAGPVLRRFGLALWGGWVLHVGLLVLIGAVAVQQAFHDGGSFELSVGEAASLSAPGALLDRERGFFAPQAPPDLEVGLLSYDPQLHQRGYAPDRASVLHLRPRGGEAVQASVDRADGIRAGPVVVYQAIPDGLALIVEVRGLGARSIHLHGVGHSASALLEAPGGQPARFTVEAEHGIAEPGGTGALSVVLESRGQAVPLSPGAVFPFGDREARLVAVGRWAGFTYARSPGMAGIFAGFAVILLGALLLVFPAGVATLEGQGDGAAARVAGRGAEVLARRWRGEDAVPPTMG